MARKQETSMEKHATTIIVSVILALLLFVGNTIYTTSNSVSRLESTLVSLQRQLDSMQADLQAQRRDSVDLGMFNALEARVSKLEDRVDEARPLTRKR